MSKRASTSGPGLMNGVPKAWQWAVLITLSLGFGTCLLLVGVPAAMLLGPLVAAIVITSFDGNLRLTPKAFIVVQGILGCMIARMLPHSMSLQVGTHWMLFAGGVLSVIAVCVALGWTLTRFRILPGSTALWGLSPGAATVMTLMAEAHGADAELVAIMQYLRVIVVAAVASILMKVLGVGTHLASAAATPLIGNVALVPFVQTMALAVVGALLGRRLRIPAGPLLVPLVLAIVASRHGWVTLELPRWLLAVTYAMLGWRIGLRFKRPLLIHALKVLPRIFACILLLILVCGVLAAILVFAAGVDPLTAYLATSPGGVDSVAIIAATSHVNVPFVMSMQMARFVAVLILGPRLARFLAAHAGRRQVGTSIRDSNN